MQFFDHIQHVSKNTHSHTRRTNVFCLVVVELVQPIVGRSLYGFIYSFWYLAAAVCGHEAKWPPTHRHWVFVLSLSSLFSQCAYPTDEGSRTSKPNAQLLQSGLPIESEWLKGVLVSQAGSPLLDYCSLSHCCRPPSFTVPALSLSLTSGTAALTSVNRQLSLACCCVAASWQEAKWERATQPQLSHTGDEQHTHSQRHTYIHTALPHLTS